MLADRIVGGGAKYNKVPIHEIGFLAIAVILCWIDLWYTYGRCEQYQPFTWIDECYTLRITNFPKFQNSDARHFSGLSTFHRFHVRGLLNPEATLHSSFQTPTHTCLFLIYVNAVQVKQNIFSIEIRSNARLLCILQMVFVALRAPVFLGSLEMGRWAPPSDEISDMQ